MCKSTMTNSWCMALLLLYYITFAVLYNPLYVPPLCSYGTLFICVLGFFFFSFLTAPLWTAFLVLFYRELYNENKSLEPWNNNNNYLFCQLKKQQQLTLCRTLHIFERGTWWTQRGRDVVTNLEEVSVLSVWHHKRLFLTILQCNSYKVSLLYSTAQFLSCC